MNRLELTVSCNTAPRHMTGSINKTGQMISRRGNSTLNEGRVRVIAFSILWLLLSAGCQKRPDQESPSSRGAGSEMLDLETRASNQDPDSEPNEVITLAIVAADVDTALEQYLQSPGGIATQCQELNDLMDQVCCGSYSLGCTLDYECRLLDLEDEILMSQTAAQYTFEEGRPMYSMHHGSVIFDVQNFMAKAQLEADSRDVLILPYTRYPILIDDEETKDEVNKVNPRDLRSHWLGLVQPNSSRRGGTRILLDYYSSSRGTLLSVTPVNTGAMAQAVAEIRSGVFSFQGKEFTGTGARDLFDLTSDGRLVPSRSGCINLSRGIRQPQ